MNRQAHRKIARNILKFFALMFGLSFVVVFSWNMAIPDLFGLEPIRFKQATGLVLLFAALAFVFNAYGTAGLKDRDLSFKR